MRRDEVVEKLKSICLSYSDILGMVILFGSYSRNEATADSDIDLYIEPKDLAMTTSKFGANKRYKEFKYSLYDTFSKDFDLLAYGGKKDLQGIRRSPIWTQINKDGIVIYDKRAESIQVIISHVSNEKHKNKEGIWMDKLACIRQVLSLFLHGDCRGLSVTEGRAEISLLYSRRDANIRSVSVL